jgi:hypothetical protein
VAILVYYLIGVVYYGMSTTAWGPLKVFYFIAISVPTIG